MRSDIFAAFFGIGLYLLYVNIGSDEGFSMDRRIILLWSIFECLMVYWHFNKQPLTQYRCSMAWKQIVESFNCHLCKYTEKTISTEISGSYLRRKCLHVT